jgi:hypothetical protein
MHIFSLDSTLVWIHDFIFGFRIFDKSADYTIVWCRNKLIVLNYVK